MRDNCIAHRIWLAAGFTLCICGFQGDLVGDEERPALWSFQPVHRVAVPQLDGHVERDPVELKSPIDSFIVSRMQSKGLRSANAADRRTLLRRATFDLIGLPPTPDEIAAFLADDSPNAFATVVERLLASPQYGERWGRHWLDVVRYADARDLIQLPAESDFREAWRYRDWVVNAFNRDLPYDKFVMQQVAGDILQPNDPGQIDADALVATGMLAIADFVPGDVDKDQMIADYVNDQIDVVGRAILGMTLACARCHDHKFDPITMADYYSLAGIFLSSKLIPGPVKGNTPIIRVPLLPAAKIAAIEATAARDKIRVMELTREIASFGEREYRTHLERRIDTETSIYLLAAWNLLHPPEGQRPPIPAEYAERQGLDLTTLNRWLEYFDETKGHPALRALCVASDKVKAEQIAQDLTKQLSQITASHHDSGEASRTIKTLSESGLFVFRADDRRLITNDQRLIQSWPNRGRRTGIAEPANPVAPPSLASTEIQGITRRVLRFSGQQSLFAAGTIPPTGSLFVVFQPDPRGMPGQRLLGWEDSSVGQHGLGIMTDQQGSLHVILRRNGASGDVVVPAPAIPGFQFLSITWGPDGVTVFRNGEPVGNNKGIDSVSSDPAITSLVIGGPGSGSSHRFQGDVAELRVYDVPLDEPSRQQVETQLKHRWLQSASDATAEDTVVDLHEELVSALSPFRTEPDERQKVLSADFHQRFEALREELNSLQKKPPTVIPKAVVIQEGGPPGTRHEGFHDANIFLRGNHLTPGSAVPRGVPKAIAGVDPPVIRDGSGRRELAKWLAGTENPLTARVMVNRIWQHHFGVGLVASSANFGVMGDPCSHPELLDYLASRFTESGWSVKSMHRLIMLSHIYQQSSGSSPAGVKLDPENRLLWRANRRRLESEAFRDSLLAVANRLDSTPGGPGFQEVALPRRSLYVMATRTGAKAAEFGPLFDAPDCSGIVERRNESIVAPQALFLMNDPLVSELAESLAQRIIHELPANDVTLRINRLYEIALGRTPTETELEVGMSLLSGRDGSDESGTQRWTGYCRLIVCTNEFMFID
jgi:hypothetical protein